MSEKYVENAAVAFIPNQKPVKYVRCNSGHINNTFFADCGNNNPGYILQLVNTEVFKNPVQLMANIKGICHHLTEKIIASGGDPNRECRQPLSTVNGEDYYIDPDGDYWRAFLSIPNVTTYNTPDSPELFYKAAVAFGHFFNLLSDYPADTLYETIPNFHNSVSRMNDFKAAVKEDKLGRAAEMRPEIEFALSKAPLCSFITDRIADGRVKLCVTHNDTKLNNVLMDKDTGEGVCIIDLDTVMPGSVLFDFGDAIRFGASTAKEDETDLSKVSIDLNMYETFLKGFVGELKGSISEEEILDLPMGAYMMTLETGIRFLGDYLNGDVYFHISYPEQNRDRARNQLKLIADMDEKLPQMIEIAKKYI